MATRSEVMEVLVDVLKEHNVDEAEATEIARDQIDGLTDTVEIDDDEEEEGEEEEE